MGAPLCPCTGQCAPRFGDSGSLEEWKWCHNVMTEADIHIRALHTSVLYIYKVFEPLLCCLKGIWLHPYTVTPAKLAPDLGIQVHLRNGNNAMMSWLRWYPPQTASYIHSRHNQSVWAIFMLSNGIWVHPYTVTPAKLPPDLGIQFHLRVGDDATTSWLRLEACCTSDDANQCPGRYMQVKIKGKKGSGKGGSP